MTRIDLFAEMLVCSSHIGSIGKMMRAGKYTPNLLREWGGELLG